MPFDWREFCELAHWLEGQATAAPNTEAALRTALSRTYYGAFCHTRNYARDFLGFEPRDEAEDHGRLRAYLKGKRRRGDADRLDRLRQWRNESDYVDELTFDFATAVSAAIAEAERVFRSLVRPK
jgi:hypothetical protein